jgi:hypothetical protein
MDLRPFQQRNRSETPRTSIRLDVLPALKDGDSCRDASGGASVGSCFTTSRRDESRSYAGSTGV